jgi:serine/threonine protein kinase
MIAGRYSLEHEVGRGGMGTVWLARDEVLGRDVAMKRLGMMPGASTPDTHRAAREARLAAMLNHPHVVAVFDLVAEGDDTWLVMEYVAGESLSQRLRRDGAMSPEQALPIIAQCADALAAAHREGIVHRDVKPSNIMLSRAGEAKLTDFGIARASADPSLTQTGLVTGSPAYLAPEVASGQLATPASDVWSLGASLYHCLAGRTPYDISDNLIGGLYKIVHEDPPRLPHAGALGRVLEGTMTRDPAGRWSMEQVLAHLRGLASGDVPTTLMPAVPAAGAVPPPRPRPRPEPTPYAGKSNGAGDEPDERRAGRAAGVLPWLVAAAALLLVAVLGFALLTSGDNGGSDQQTTGASQTTPDGKKDRSPKPTPSKSKSKSTSPGSPDPEETRAAMEAFVSDYLATAPTDSRATYAQLTPGFQAASGSYDGYSGFWDTVESATLESVTADPETLVVTYRVAYVMKNGRQTSDDVTLHLVRDRERFLIDGEA